MLGGKIMIVLGIVILTEGNTTALGVGNLTILNNPTLAPVRSYHTVLESCRRSPCGSRLLNIEAGYGNVAASLLLREETTTTNVNLNILLIRVKFMEISIDNSIVTVLLSKPLIYRELGVPRRCVNLSRKTLLEALCLI